METLISDNLTWLRAALCRCLAFRKGVDADDLLSRLLENMWRYRKSFDGKNFRSWATVIAHNCVKRIRRENARKRNDTSKLVYTGGFEMPDKREQHIDSAIDKEVYIKWIAGNKKEITAAFRMLAAGYSPKDVHELLGKFAYQAIYRRRRCVR